MRFLRNMVVGALAVCGFAFAQAPASARTMSAPELIQVSTVQPAKVADATASCQWRRPGWRRYGWRRHYGYHPYYGWRRPIYRRPYYGYRRPFYGYHRPFYGHRGYGWHHGRRFY